MIHSPPHDAPHRMGLYVFYVRKWKRDHVLFQFRKCKENKKPNLSWESIADIRAVPLYVSTLKGGQKNSQVVPHCCPLVFLQISSLHHFCGYIHRMITYSYGVIDGGQYHNYLFGAWLW